ncbi:monooxygenase, putative [Talaromyces stipitatus ATCC 10500]|uniref:Monooxygenase, putative n=1 Tax=Talaromyces stipitatus (strain ATCC 10500 / CBS 375.48 / QM 6759 / NRRL 1006) TaxID=441959 RepID=B8LYD3_TALSN|nr:monooxygenase, putative [Talaromyces stipitatus ATCC 10500]EED22862.1 monooxygenase, putative [Talaromyces stipitatus ATCC 10500]
MPRTTATTETIHVPVLIVGGGIVGLSASLFLSHNDIHSLLVERHSSTSIHPRARSVNARTMEIFGSIGLSELVRDAGASLAPSKGILHSNDSFKSVMEARPRMQKNPATDTRGWFVRWAKIGPEDGTFVTQDMLEPVLLKVAAERGGDIRFHTECTGIRQDQEKVTATIQNRETGDTITVIADYLIAADGANSPIRSQLKVPTTGRGTMGHLLNILFQADLKDLVEKREISLCVIDRPEVAGLLTAINNSDRWVFHLSYDPSRNEKPGDLSPEICRELLRIALGIPDLKIRILSILPWQPSVRVATKLQHGRTFLAGDAAHQMPPYGGQGANTGISDAYNLAWKLSLVLKDMAHPRLLETYGIERLPVGKVAAEASAAPADDRGLISPLKLNWKTLNGWSKIVPLTSGFGSAVIEENTWPLRGVTWKAWSAPSLLHSLDGRPGSRAPHVWVEKDGKTISTLDLLGKGFVLLIGNEGKGAWTEALETVKLKFKDLELIGYCVGPNGKIIVKRSKEWEIAAGISSNGALLVRPDGFVAWRQRKIPTEVQAELERVIRKILCL